jgi:hypothetical protein
MNITNYSPNFDDPRIQRRIERALEFCQLISASKPNWLSTRAIAQHFGNTSQPLGRYLKSQLLKEVDSHYSMQSGICKKYILNKLNADVLAKKIGLKSVTLTSKLIKKYEEELKSGLFQYNKTSNRQYHPIQNLPKSVKITAMRQYGYNYDYDIVCCAPALITQYARKLGLKQPTPHIDLYISNRTQIREQIAQQYSMPVKSVKTAITALFQGAFLSFNHQTRIYQELAGDTRQIQCLKDDVYITQLRKEIKTVWDQIKPTMPKQFSNNKKKNSEEFKLKRVSGRQKAQLYRELEEQVMKEIERYLKKHNHAYLLEHDGWRTREMIDPIELRDLVRTKTGYVVDIDWEKLTDENE